MSLALAVADPRYPVVLVHDAARPLVPASLVDAVTAAVLAGADAVVPGLPVTDTIKRIMRPGGCWAPSTARSGRRADAAGVPPRGSPGGACLGEQRGHR